MSPYELSFPYKFCLDFQSLKPPGSSVPDPDPDPTDPNVLGHPDPDLLVRCMDPDPVPDPSIIKQKK